MPVTTSRATNLTAEQIADLRTEARRSGPFIDPAAFRTVRTTSFHGEWATTVLGRPYDGGGRLAAWEITLLAMALYAEPERPVPTAEQTRREGTHSAPSMSSYAS